MSTFDGATFNPEQDGERLASLQTRVTAFLRDQKWHELSEIATVCHGSEASVSARIRDCRKARFGNYQVDKRRVAGANGLWEYRLVISERPDSAKHEQEGLFA